jgi:multidrug transporter EmrE-like cation transporter
MTRLLDHTYIIATIAFTVYSQMIIRWQVSKSGELPELFIGKLYFVTNLLLNPWVISAIFATFLAGVSWMLVLSRFEISYAYPWVGLNFVLILILAVAFFGESYSFMKALGTLLILFGIVIISKG